MDSATLGWNAHGELDSIYKPQALDGVCFRCAEVGWEFADRQGARFTSTADARLN